MFKIYVGNLDYKTEKDDILRLFQRFGPIEDVALAEDKATGKRRGFAIVMIRDELRARLAIETLAGTKLRGRSLVINEAITKKGGKTPSFKELRKGPLGPRAMGINPRRAGSRNPRRSFGRSGGGPPGAGGVGPRGSDGGPGGSN
jgi:RNA recognition motif-containing protein